MRYQTALRPDSPIISTDEVLLRERREALPRSLTPLMRPTLQRLRPLKQVPARGSGEVEAIGLLRGHRAARRLHCGRKRAAVLHFSQRVGYARREPGRCSGVPGTGFWCIPCSNTAAGLAWPRANAGCGDVPVPLGCAQFHLQRRAGRMSVESAWEPTWKPREMPGRDACPWGADPWEVRLAKERSVSIHYR